MNRESLIKVQQGMKILMGSTERACDLIMEAFQENEREHEKQVAGLQAEINRLRQEAKIAPKQNGVTIDHQTFSRLVNTLSYGVSEGTVETDLYNKVLSIGKQQTATPDIKKYSGKIDGAREISAPTATLKENSRENTFNPLESRENIISFLSALLGGQIQIITEEQLREEMTKRNM